MIRGLEEMAIIKPMELQKKVIPFLLRDGGPHRACADRHGLYGGVWPATGDKDESQASAHLGAGVGADA